MMRFFWMTFLPLSAAGGAAAFLLWLARPALRRFAHIQWSVPVLTAALCLFVLPLPVFAMPGAWNAPAQAVQSSVGTVLPAEAAASEPLFVMTELPTAADKLLRAAPQEHISMLWGLVPAFWLAGVLCVTLALWAEYRRFTRHLAREARPVEPQCGGAWHMPQRRVAFPGAWGCMYAARWQRLLRWECCARAFTCPRTGLRTKRWSMLCDMNACICAGGILCTSWRRRLCVLYIGSIRPRGCCGV